MKKWKLIISLFVIMILVVQAFRIYTNTNRDLETIQQQAIKRAIQETEISIVHDVSFYYGTKAYQVVQGGNEHDESFIAWIPEDKEQKVLLKEQSDGLTKEQVEEHVLKERDPLTIKEIRLGIENDNPLWEITYIDQENRFTYYYIDFKSGDFLKRYSLKPRQFKGEF